MHFSNKNINSKYFKKRCLIKNILVYNINKMHPDINVPPQDRNPYTIWYKYAHQNLNLYNKIAKKYNMARLQYPLYIGH